MLTGILLNQLIALVTGGCIRYVPLKDKLRVPVWAIFLIYTPIFCLQGVILAAATGAGPMDYLDGQMFQTLAGLLTIFLPFLLTRKSFFQNLFLISMVANYNLIVIGIGNYAELAMGGALAERYPYLISNTVKLLLSVLVLPLLLKTLKAMLALMPTGESIIWRFYWIIPALLAGLCLLTSGFYRGEDIIKSLSFIVARLFVGAGCVAICYFMAQSFSRELENATLMENARMTEHLLHLQREQYTNLSKNIAQAKAARHDLRHQLSVLGTYHARGDLEGLGQYLHQLTDALPAAPEQIWCENYAVNAISSYYLSKAKADCIALDVRLDIPQKIGAILDVDLCIILGNLLENALEACCRMEKSDQDRYIKLRSRTQGDYLSLLLENSFDGIFSKCNGCFLSRKEIDGISVARKGVGISSVRAIAEKYDGTLRVEAEENLFRVSVLVSMKTVERQLC